MDNSRERKIRRTRRAQQGVVALGAAGALGTAVALGAAAAANSAAAAPGSDRSTSTGTSQRAQPPATGQGNHETQPAPKARPRASSTGSSLASQGSGGSSHATSSGS